ncbi:MAG: hypothetical protein SRB2_02390 [Desulfobacteraceae bacterium Eth-SRB2]|nr:MAG: hypothetical protein SRB2_02390 [Desulfobacteraceae bacterium Eth-SRB2]
MKSRFKQIGKDSLVYGIGGVMSKAIGFFLLPVYTRIFTPADYGTIEMLTVLNGLLGAILVMGMDSAQSFYFFEQKKTGGNAQARVVTAILQWRISWGSGIVILATLVSPLLNQYFFNDQLSWEYFVIAFVGALFAQIMSQSAEVYRLLYRPWSYITIIMGQALASAAIAITLIVGFGCGIMGFFIGMLSGSVIAAAFGWWRIRNYLDLSEWHTDLWPKVLKFGAPLIPTALAMYILNTADRWFISHINGPETLGLYAVGAKFAMLMAIIVTTFRTAWWPVIMDSIQSSDGPALLRTMSSLYLGLGCAGIILLTALSPFLVRILTPLPFHAAYPIVGILAWQSMFYGFNLIVTIGIWKKEKTIWISILMGAVALLNIVLDVLLVPEYGGIGAALATSTSFLVWNILTLIVSEKLWPVGYRFRNLGMQIGIGMTACFLILYVYEKEILLWRIALISFVSIIILCALSVSLEHLSKLIDLVKKKKSGKNWQII